MAHVYESRKDADGFLYITYTDETTLGVIQEEEEWCQNLIARVKFI